MLGVESGNKVAFDARGTQVVVSRAEAQPHTDPAITVFLALLEQDIRSGKRISALPEGLASSMAAAAEHAPTDDEIEGDVFMTGEITLTGQVLPVGGIRE